MDNPRTSNIFWKCRHFVKKFRLLKKFPKNFSQILPKVLTRNFVIINRSSDHLVTVVRGISIDAVMQTIFWFHVRVQPLQMSHYEAGFHYMSLLFSFFHGCNKEQENFSAKLILRLVSLNIWAAWMTIFTSIAYWFQVQKLLSSINAVCGD